MSEPADAAVVVAVGSCRWASQVPSFVAEAECCSAIDAYSLEAVAG